MLIKRIDGATRVLGKSQGYRGLPVLDHDADDGTHMMMSAWEPTPEEIQKIVAGAPIYLTVVGFAHPPVMLSVGAVPE